MKKQHYAAVDCGQSGGKIVDFSFDGDKLVYEKSFPFRYEPVTVRGSLYVDILGMYGIMCRSIAALVQELGPGSVKCVGTTTWGGGYAFFDDRGQMVGNSISHRDAGVVASAQQFGLLVPEREYYNATGTHFASHVGANMLFFDKAHSAAYEAASFLLPTPSVFNYFMSGVAAMDETIGTATGFMKLGGGLNTAILERTGLRTDLLPNTVSCGTKLGTAEKSFAETVGDSGINVVCAPGHDTAACLPAIPGMDEHSLFVSMGTMILSGMETAAPCVGEGMYAKGQRTVASVGEKFISYGDKQGFWIMNRCLDDFDRRGLNTDFSVLEQAAAKLPSGRCVIDTNDPLFYLGERPMPQRIREYCRASGQFVPESEFDVYRCLIDSYTYNVLSSLRGLAEAGERKFDKIHLVNGGCQSPLLCNTIAAASGLPVHYGMRYASAAGNVLTQLQGMGELSGLSEMRALASHSFGMQLADVPHDSNWDDIYARAASL